MPHKLSQALLLEGRPVPAAARPVEELLHGLPGAKLILWHEMDAEWLAIARAKFWDTPEIIAIFALPGADFGMVAFGRYSGDRWLANPGARAVARAFFEALGVELPSGEEEIN